MSRKKNRTLVYAFRIKTMEQFETVASQITSGRIVFSNVMSKGRLRDCSHLEIVTHRVNQTSLRILVDPKTLKVRYTMTEKNKSNLKYAIINTRSNLFKEIKQMLDIRSI